MTGTIPNPNNTIKIIVVFLAAMVVATGAVSYAQPMNSAWPMFHSYANRTGQSAYPSYTNGTVDWTYTTGSTIEGSPAIASDGTVYVGSMDGKLYVIYPDGVLKWSYATSEGTIIATPSIASDGTIYIGAIHSFPRYSIGTFYAINPDGTQKWNYTSIGGVISSAVVALDGTIYFGAQDGNLYALNSDGTLKWTFPTSNYIDSSPAIAADGTIYFGSEDGNIYSLYPNGTLKWARLIGNIPVDSSPAVSRDGTVYIGSTDSNIYALNPDGTLKWSYATGDSIWQSSPAVATDGTVYVGSYDNNIYALNPTGTLKWKYAVAGWGIDSSPAIDANGDVYVGGGDGKVYSLYPNGTLRWSYTTGDIVFSSPAIGENGTVYVGSNDGKIYAFESFPTTPPAPVLPDISVSNVRPVQVVFGADINGDGRMDLVKGKNTSIIINLNVINSDALPNDANIDFLVNMSGLQSFTQTFKGSDVKTGQVRLFFVPNFDGDATINVTVNPLCSVNEIDCSNNSNSTNVTVKDTKDFLIVYKSVDYLGPVGDYSGTVGNSTLFLNATYPLNPQKFNIDNTNPSFTPPPHLPTKTPIASFINILSDMSTLCIEGQLQSSFHANTVAGIVSDNYFGFYGRTDVGLANPGLGPLICGVLVQQDFWTVTAHEVGHLNGLPVNPAFGTNGKEEYNSTYDGNPASGFWVDNDTNVSGSTCFMGNAPFKTDDRSQNNPLGRWIDGPDYVHLFKNFATDPSDPEGLLVSGLIFKNGTVVLGNWYSFSNGTLDSLPQGNFSIQTLDRMGNVLNQTSFNAAFTLDFDPTGPVETNVTGFAFKIPFPENTSSVRISFNNVTKVEVNPNSKSLRDAINSIPDFGFEKNPEKSRKLLLKEVDVFEKLLEKHKKGKAVEESKINAAIAILKHVIRKSVEKLVIDYTPQNPLQLSKGYILDLVDNTVERLQGTVMPNSKVPARIMNINPDSLNDSNLDVLSQLGEIRGD